MQQHIHQILLRVSPGASLDSRGGPPNFASLLENGKITMCDTRESLVAIWRKRHPPKPQHKTASLRKHIYAHFQATPLQMPETSSQGSLSLLSVYELCLINYGVILSFSPDVPQNKMPYSWARLGWHRAEGASSPGFWI